MRTKNILPLLFFFVATNLFSQDTLRGSISGKVIDAETYQPLPGVVVRVLHTSFGAITDVDGAFSIHRIPTGRYSLTAQSIGYHPQTMADVVVVTKRASVVRFEMKLDAIQLSEVVITPDRITMDDAKPRTSAFSISNQEVARTPGASDLFRRLQFISGVGRASESSSALIVRGGDPEENLTLIENIEVFSPFHFSSLSGEVAGSLSIVEPKLIENVRIATGGFGAQYGDKLSSVTNITLREPERQRINGDVSLDFSGLSAFFSGPLTSNISWTIAGRRGILDWLMNMMDEKFIPITTDVHTKWTFDLSGNHKISLLGLYAQDNMEGSHSGDVFEDDIIFSNVTKEQSTVGANWRWLLSPNSFLLVTPFLNRNAWTLTHGSESNKEAFGDENIENISGVKAELFYRLSERHRITLGAEYKHIAAQYFRRAADDTLSDGTAIPAFTIFFGAEASYKIASFVQYNLTPFDWLELTAGLRQEYFHFIDRQTLTPRLAATIRASDDVRINLAWGKHTQYPAFYRIFSSPENKKLNPSEAMHSIIGVEYDLSPDLQLKAEAYYKNLSSLPIAEDDTTKIFRSIGEGYARGVELSLTKRMTDNLYVLVNYTYSNSSRKDNAASPSYDFRFDRPHTLNMLATYRLGDWWEFSLTAAYSSGFPFTPFDLSTRKNINGVWYCEKGAKNSERYPDYFRIDIRAERRFVFASWNLRLFAELWNVTNHENVFEYSYSRDYSQRLTETLFPFMPIVGVAAEF